MLTRQQEALLPWWVASIQCPAASLQWHARSFQSQATLLSSSWRLSLFRWRAAEFLQRVADFQWWVRELVQAGNPAGGTVNAFACWDWIDGAPPPLHHLSLRRESTAYAEVLLIQMAAWSGAGRRSGPGHISLTSSLFILHDVKRSLWCHVCPGDNISYFMMKLYTNMA